MKRTFYSVIKKFINLEERVEEVTIAVFSDKNNATDLINVLLREKQEGTSYFIEEWSIGD